MSTGEGEGGPSRGMGAVLLAPLEPCTFGLHCSIVQSRGHDGVGVTWLPYKYNRSLLVAQAGPMLPSVVSPARWALLSLTLGGSRAVVMALASLCGPHPHSSSVAGPTRGLDCLRAGLCREGKVARLPSAQSHSLTGCREAVE